MKPPGNISAPVALFFSISSAVCVFWVGQNTKQQRGIVEQKSLKGFVEEEEEEEKGGEGWR